MAFSRSVFIILLLSVVCNASNVPAFLWGDLAEPNLKSNPLTATTAPEFSDILSNELAQEPFTAIFVEPTLSIEDFSRRNALGETSFPYLYQNLRKSVYLPSVDNAMLAIELLDDPKKVDRVQLTEDGLSQAIVPSSGKFLIIYMNDARPDESRAELLRRHNDFMRDTISELKMHNDKVVGVYTANGPSWTIPHSRLRRQAESNASSDYVLDGLRLYAKNIKLVDGATTTSLHGLTSSSSVFNAENLTQTTTLNFDATSIALNFKGTGGYWYFESVTLNPGTATPEEFSPAEEVFALIDFSYRCGPNVTFVYGNSTKHMFFEDLKIQPVFHSTNESNQVVFGDSFNCVGFFSAPIWSSLFVVFILLSITFYGIMMMMDIRTMDRFDDPKGKTITINAAE